MTKTLTQADLRQFTGSEQWYRHAINRQMLFTDGVKHIADTGGAYWLVDEVALAQQHIAAVSAEEFQVWNLTVRPDHTATLACSDGNYKTVFSKEIEFTDFPLDAIELWFTDATLYLPSEH